MSRKMAHSLLLMVVVAALMIGGDMVQEGRQEMWHADPSIPLASGQDTTTGIDGVGIDLEADLISDEVIVTRETCPHAHRDF